MGSRTGYTDRREMQQGRPYKRSVFREYAETLLICAIAIIFVRAFVFQQSEIPSESMLDPLLVGDHVLVNRFIYAPTTFSWERAILPRRDIRRGDVVVFKHPPGPEQDYIKRVIGLPGETVVLRDGALWIDGRRVLEPYLLREDALTGQDYGPEVVRPDSYFMMGDNRAHSQDSRAWGQASRDLIKGRAFMVLFSTGGPERGPDRGRVTPASVVRKLYNMVFNMRWGRSFSAVR